jgi:S-methylmethionine-dependent homocysteine/selenocysteine methylase
MTQEEAQAYHDKQVRVFEDSAADMVTAITMNYVEEAIGIAKAAERAAMPVAISFTVEPIPRISSTCWPQASLGRNGYGGCGPTPPARATPN